MPFAIADSFRDSLTDLTNSEQKRVKQKVMDLQMDRANPGFQFHRLDNAKDDHFWSARMGSDLRLIVHKQGDTFVVCYVDHHDDAYDWAERRKLVKNDKTGALQYVKIEERTEEVIHREHVQKEAPLLDQYEEEYLLKLGVPPEWLDAVRNAGETGLYKLVEELPEEVSERLMKLADGDPVPVPDQQTKAVQQDPFEHPDTQRRFQIVDDHAQLRQALKWPWERWVVFLHPEQRDAIEKTYNGPAYVSGGAGTGKTVAALHWANRMLKESDDEVLFTTFSKTLASQLEHGMDILVGEDESRRERLDITHLHKLAKSIWTDGSNRRLNIAKEDELRDLLSNAAAQDGYYEHSDEFLYNEWDAVIDAWGIRDWETYRDFSRRGRGTPLGAKQRYRLWSVFERVLGELSDSNRHTWSSLCYDCMELVERDPSLGFEHVVVDEAQDFGPAELRLLESLGTGDQNNLFLAGDTGQRLYKRYFNWSDVGIHVVGRSKRLKVNYRTTEQIRQFADQLMPPDMEEHGGTKGDRDSVSLLSGIEPNVQGFEDPADESTCVAEHISDLLDDGLAPEDIAIFARTRHTLKQRAVDALELIDVDYTWLEDVISGRPDNLALGTMHRAKGLEFRAVIVMGCEKGKVPLKWTLQDAPDDAARQDLVERERNLLYVACTRARESLLVTYTGEASPLLEDLG
mgnify:CR=1 FL=1